MNPLAHTNLGRHGVVEQVVGGGEVAVQQGQCSPQDFAVVVLGQVQKNLEQRVLPAGLEVLDHGQQLAGLLRILAYFIGSYFKGA